MKQFSSFLACFLVASISQAGPGEAGGGFADRNGEYVLNGIAAKLAARVRVLSPRVMFNVPSAWTPARVADVIKNVKINSSPESLKVQAAGRLKVIDYDRRRNTITALAGFFLQYSDVIESVHPQESRIKNVERRLLHEVAHLWGANETQASNFARDTLFLIQRNVIRCSFDDSNHVARAFTFDPAFEKVYWLSGATKVLINNDDPMYELPKFDKWSMVSKAAWSQTPNTIRLTVTTLDKSLADKSFTLQISRHTDEEGLSLNSTVEDEGRSLPAACSVPIYSLEMKLD